MKKSKSGFWICVLPALICFAMVVLIPAITGLLYSFTDWNGMNKPVSFAGLENYRGLISDKVFWRDFLYTAEFSVVAVILVNLLGFALALLVTQKIRGANFVSYCVLYAQLDWRYPSWICMAVCVYTGVQLLRKITKYFMASGMVVYTIYIYRWINDCSCLAAGGIYDDRVYSTAAEYS